MQQREPSFFASENPSPVMRVSLDGTLIYANPASDDIMSVWKMTEDEHLPEAAMKVLNECIRFEKSLDLEVQVGKSIYLLTFVPFLERNYLNIYGYDISPRKQYLHQLSKVENFDALTDLPNRKQLLLKLRDALDNCWQQDNLGALLIIDIDNFRSINQTLGPQVADGLLQAVAQRLADCVPLEYPIARISNDDFAVIRHHLNDQADAANLAQIILDNLAQPFLVHNHDIQVSFSIGITIFPTDSDDITHLISCASLAQEKAKEVKGNSYHFFRGYMHSAANARRSLLKDLRYALSREQLLVYYQPQIRLSDMKIIGTEALIRWQHPKHGLMTPSRFTSLAEEHGLINSIGEWVLHSACKQTKEWQDLGFKDLSVAVNVSPLQFNHTDLYVVLQRILEETNISPDSLELEITENSLIEDLNAAKKLLTRLRTLGIKLAIDDFGTGFSSLSYLQELAVNKLKIDKCFVDAISEDHTQVTIIDNIIDLGHKMKMQIIAEGVETKEELEFLIKHDCDEVQGFYFSEPLTANELKQLLLNQ